MSELAPGIQEMNTLQDAGFSPSEIDNWRAEQTTTLQDAGFSGEEIRDYFGEKTPDMSQVETTFKTNLQTKREAKAQSTAGTGQPATLQPHVEQADSFLEAIEAGFDMSVSGLIKERPDMVLPENAPMFYRIASQVGTLAGDVPAMIAGAVAGGAAGAAAGTVTLPVVGTVGLGVVGAGAGAFALPEGMRTALIEHYEKGDVKSFSDFWERSSAVAINSLKAGVIGGATAGVGGVVGKVAAKTALPAAVKTTAQLTSEVMTMTTVGAALEGKVPEPHEFLDAAILVGGLRGATKVASKARQLYAKRGTTPMELVEKAQQEPHVKQQLLSDNAEVVMGGEMGARTVPAETIPTTKQFKIKNPELSPEVNQILGKVGEKAKPEAKELTTSQIYTALVDKLDPINEATKVLAGKATELPADANPYVLARTAVDYKGKAKHMFENGVLEYSTLKNRGGSLRSALESVESVETLEAYMISKRVVEKSKQGYKTGFDVEVAKKVVEQNASKYENAAAKVTEFSNGVLDYVQQAGVLSKEQLARMKEMNKDYVPFKRIMEEGDKSGRKSGKGGSLKEFKGSERDIQSPITSIVENTIELVRLAEVNRPKTALVKLAEKTPGQEIIKKVPDRKEAITVKAEEIVRALEDQGAITTIESIKKDLKSKGLPVTEEMIAKSFEKENLFQAEAIKDMIIFRKQHMDLAKNQFAVFKDGKRQVYETTPELAESIARLGGDASATNVLFKIANGVTTVKKIGITFTPEFIAKNLFRDYLTATSFSKGGKITPLDIVGAMGDLLKKNQTYYDWIKSGGSNGAFLDMGNRYIATDIVKLQRQTNFMGSARNIADTPFALMRVASALAEQSLRVAEFKKVRAKGGSLIEGGMASREITIDFQRVGAKISALNSMTAFMNVSIQGLDRTARAFKENPTQMGARAVTTITLPSVLLWWANHDDPRYQEIPRWEKDLFWIIPTDDWQDSTPEEADGLPEYMVRESGGKFQINKGTIYRLPKPQELGVLFGSLPERTLEAFFGENPGAYKDFEETMIGLVTPSMVPDAVAPAVEQYFNQSFFTGREIVPHHLKDVLPEYQFVEYTSETAKTLGKMVATIDRHSEFASPMVLQNYIRSWGGSLGQYAVQAADAALTKAGVAPDNVDPTSTLSDLPFIKAFVVRFPQAGSNSVQDFYTQYEENQKVLNTIRHLAKEGDFNSMEKELLLQSNQDNLVQLDGIREALSTQSKFIRLVHKNPEMTADEKRQMIDGMYLMMTETAKQGNALMAQVKQELEQVGGTDGN